MNEEYDLLIELLDVVIKESKEHGYITTEHLKRVKQEFLDKQKHKEEIPQ